MNNKEKGLLFTSLSTIMRALSEIVEDEKTKMMLDAGELACTLTAMSHISNEENDD